MVDEMPGVSPTAACARAQPGTGTNRSCLLYTSDAADERSSVDLGGRRIIKKKKSEEEEAEGESKEKKQKPEDIQGAKK